MFFFKGNKNTHFLRKDAKEIIKKNQHWSDSIEKTCLKTELKKISVQEKSFTMTKL